MIQQFHFLVFFQRMEETIVTKHICAPLFTEALFTIANIWREPTCPLIDESKRKKWYQFSSVQSLSCVRLFATPWIAACQASLSITNSQSSLKLMSIELAMPSSHLILCRPLLLLPLIPPSIRLFSSESTLCMRWPSIGVSALASVLPKNTFRMGWLDLLAVQGTLKSLLQHHNSNVSIIWHSAFFTVQV